MSFRKYSGHTENAVLLGDVEEPQSPTSDPEANAGMETASAICVFVVIQHHYI